MDAVDESTRLASGSGLTFVDDFFQQVVQEAGGDISADEILKIVRSCDDLLRKSSDGDNVAYIRRVLMYLEKLPNQSQALQKIILHGKENVDKVVDQVRSNGGSKRKLGVDDMKHEGDEKKAKTVTDGENLGVRENGHHEDKKSNTNSTTNDASKVNGGGSRTLGKTDDGIEFKIVTNDDSEENMIWLINVKEIFAKQLPKMPREYIVRLVMDRKHYSLVCIKENSVIGGVCFRPYMQQRFAEIAFLAVSASHQVKGFGTLLMNHLKQYVKTIKLTHFLTYADNYAIGYFRKQGFTKNITMPKERWRGYIKDYDGGTLMECAINEYVDYLRIPEMVAAQRKFLYAKIKNTANANMIYPGLTLFREDKTITNLVEQVPGIKEAGWGVPIRGLVPIPRTVPLGVAQPASNQDHEENNNSGNNSNDDEEEDDDDEQKNKDEEDNNQDGEDENQQNQANVFTGEISEEIMKAYQLSSKLQSILRKVKLHKDSWPFHEPVPDSVTDYLEVVQDPIDLSLIKKRLDHNQYYVSAQLFYDDLKKMVDNCRLYNHPDTPYYKAADSLEEYFMALFKEMELPIESSKKVKN